MKPPVFIEKTIDYDNNIGEVYFLLTNGHRIRILLPVGTVFDNVWHIQFYNPSGGNYHTYKLLSDDIDGTHTKDRVKVFALSQYLGLYLDGDWRAMV